MQMLISASVPKLSNPMLRYADNLSLREARDLFFRDAKLGADGGYESKWVRVETKPIPFYFPNWPARVAAARLHDLHHIAAEYATDWRGEAEIAAWEIASGCAGYYAAWLLNFGGFGAGLLLAPKRLFRAFVRGRRAVTNLYKTGFDERHLNEMSVGALRVQLGLRNDFSSARPLDVALFLLWCVPSIISWLPVPLLVTIAFWLIVRTAFSNL
jgi:hypothetical protein